ncbi:MAG TPA: dihydroneopterin triphosphate diphosphatase [Gammaproteobacteria bacterium]
MPGRPERTPQPDPRGPDRETAADDADPAYRRPESVLVVIHDAARACLLLERVVPAGFWQSVTGSLQWGEAPADGAAREVVEETGLDPAGLREANVRRRFRILPEWRHRYPPGVEENLEHLFYLELPEALPVTIDPREHRRYLWLPLEEAIARVGSWTNREALERLRASAANEGHE